MTEASTQQQQREMAFGAPGLPPTQSFGDKDAVTCALGTSRVWATLAHGIITDVFWPNPSRIQLRDIGFIVTGKDFWCEVQRNSNYELTVADQAVPLPAIVHHHERFELRIRVVCATDIDSLTIEYDLQPQGLSVLDSTLRLHALLTPHIGGTGDNDSAWVAGDTLHAGHASLNTDNGYAPEHLAVKCDPAPSQISVGYVGFSDGWQDINHNGTCTYQFTDAPDGSVALTATMSSLAGRMAVGFASSATEAADHARLSLEQSGNQLVNQFVGGWNDWATQLPTFHDDPQLESLARTSAMVIKAHCDITDAGAIVASLATPWGFAHNDIGGYHLVWPRDCAESALALASVGLVDEAHATARFLASTQTADGHWPQNFTTDGEPYWTGIQLDETSLPVVLVLKLTELGVVQPTDELLRPMVRAAIKFIVTNGPYTQQDRWEESAGASPFTLAASIAALAGAAECGWLEDGEAAYALSLADDWNARIESQVFVTDSPLDHQYETSGHYVRIAKPGREGLRGQMVVANRSGLVDHIERLVGLEFLALVRFGLRDAHDPKIVDTVRIIDGEIRVETPAGPLYHRYQNDGYGEHDDGSAFDGSGVGRLWPLLAGERGAYAVAAGEDPMPYLRAMASTVSKGNLLPEQVWNAPDIPEKHLFTYKPSGSATPLVWAHGEFLKLLIAANGEPHPDRLRSVYNRYSQFVAIRCAHLCHELDHHVDIDTDDRPNVWIESSGPFMLHYGFDGWQRTIDVASIPISFERHGVCIEAASLTDVAQINWTRFDQTTDAWEGIDHVVEMISTK